MANNEGTDGAGGEKLPAWLQLQLTPSQDYVKIKEVWLTPATDTTDKKVMIQTIDANTRILAATAYGEASVNNVFEEMAAIANVIVRQQKCRGYANVKAFISVDRTFAYAAHDGNKRFKKLMVAKATEIMKDKSGMAAAVRAAVNALSDNPTDYSNGAFFWDGADIKTKYDTHPKVQEHGIHFTDPKHDIYSIKDKDVPGENFWQNAQRQNTTSRGTWRYKYESTTAIGGTIYWKYNADFLHASGNKEYN